MTDRDDVENLTNALHEAVLAVNNALTDDGLKLVELGFEPATLITRLDLAYRFEATDVQVANMIDPAMWKLQPFFRESAWIGALPDPQTGACSGLFYEHLDFSIGGELLRSVQNHLIVSYSGWDPHAAGPKPSKKHPQRIGCTFNLHESIDNLFSIDRGWYRAESTSPGTWTVEMHKEIRFSDIQNTLLGPMLLMYWQQAALADLSTRYILMPKDPTAIERMS